MRFFINTIYITAEVIILKASNSSLFTETTHFHITSKKNRCAYCCNIYSLLTIKLQPHCVFSFGSALVKSILLFWVHCWVEVWSWFPLIRCKNTPLTSVDFLLLYISKSVWMQSELSFIRKRFELWSVLRSRIIPQTTDGCDRADIVGCRELKQQVSTQTDFKTYQELRFPWDSLLCMFRKLNLHLSALYHWLCKHLHHLSLCSVWSDLQIAPFLMEIPFRSSCATQTSN